MAIAGLRPGEAAALRWQDVDMGASTLRIVESRTMGVTGTPKSGIGRSVPMPDEVAVALQDVRARKLMPRRVDRVFVGRAVAHVDSEEIVVRVTDDHGTTPTTPTSAD